MRIALLPLVLLLAANAAAAEAETTGMKVLIDGRKIGHLVQTREVDGDRVTTTERMEAAIDRAGISIAMTTEERSVETRDGRPVSFSSEAGLSGVTTTTHGEVVGNEARVTTTSFGRTDERTIPWPAGAVLSEGARLAESRHGLAPGTTFEMLAFEPSNLIAVPVRTRVVGPERVTTGLVVEELIRIEQRIELPGSPIEALAWVDSKHQLRKTVLPLLGMSFEMVACDEACAKAPNQPADLLDRTMVAAPRALSRDERANEIETSIALTGTSEATLPSVGEQRSTRDGARAWRVNINPDAVRDRSPPKPADSAATRWLESDAPEVGALARKGAGNAKGDFARMSALESHVRGYISRKSLRVGYASALETVRSREGDCTEHALLLAALGRSLGIPTRVVNGLAYADEFAGRSHVFVPHAWVQAWIGDRWESFDAALPGYDAVHIAFAVNDGDPAGFYSSVNLLGNIVISGFRTGSAQ
ncbi:MAG TPA: transglutaminase-like domain-containing protein [Candidatus Saccharimonadia bacterium]|nr:transglutaminase-like domain-containing protein [Candidatus Saccharimonadia bacterium]